MNKHLSIWSKTAVGFEKFEQKRQSLLQAFYEKALICMKILAKHIFTPWFRSVLSRFF